MLAAPKICLNAGKSKFGKMLEEKTFLRSLSTTLLQIFGKANFDFQIIIKSIIHPDFKFYNFKSDFSALIG